MANIFNSTAVAQRVEDSNGGLDLGASIRDLADDDPRVRRNARDALIALGPTAVAPMLEAWQKDQADAKLKVGTVVVVK